ncbi:MAG: DNA photolyase family protein [Natronospirillum sp.]|uniref:cryptochrome/photolyase family protein n=1 Tax=Natronospirillum sp. TaxID=2812955 RepID=UPI0025F7DCEF|nr:deoxyribodipyrimidine photo-lyase [Natronospirillum sp.]MCH8550606.1 DNA photolyase family protein [Natronospirillum sp.]
MTLIWLRTSLRVLDNPIWQYSGALDQGAADTTLILTPALEQYRQHGYGERKLDLLRTQQKAFAEWARASGIRVHWLEADTYRAAAEQVLQVAHDKGAAVLLADREYGLNERRRDAWLGKRLNAQGIDFTLVDDRLTYPPETVLNGQGQPYRVFTAFKKAWRQRWSEHPVPPFASPAWAGPLPEPEQEAIAALQRYVASEQQRYEEVRNDLGRPVVSGLSPAIANGLLTTRQAFAETAAQATGSGEQPGADKWLDEWIWREFFYAVGYHFPDVYLHRGLQAWTDLVRWDKDHKKLQAWQQGRTGYPVVDAAMRQLAATGRMPNRARMFTAAFLSKDLLLDWRLGEAWFLDQLLDADFAVNNGNWQWGASTGVDAAPYFRIFNPLRQAQRFDPDGDYVRQWVPELAHLEGAAILDPSPLEREAAGYPPPLVIHKEAAERTKAAFKAAKEQNAHLPEDADYS